MSAGFYLGSIRTAYMRVYGLTAHLDTWRVGNARPFGHCWRLRQLLGGEVRNHWPFTQCLRADIRGRLTTIWTKSLGWP